MIIYYDITLIENLTRWESYGAGAEKLDSDDVVLWLMSTDIRVSLSLAYAGFEISRANNTVLL